MVDEERHVKDKGASNGAADVDPEIPSSETWRKTPQALVINASKSKNSIRT